MFHPQVFMYAFNTLYDNWYGASGEHVLSTNGIKTVAYHRDFMAYLLQYMDLKLVLYREHNVNCI